MAVYACSDLHGHLELYKKIKEYLNPEDKVYYLGDAGDRGPECWETVKAIYNDEQFIYIKGNHEDMLVRAAKDYLYPKGIPSQDYMLLVRNGGERTFDGWEMEEDRVKWLKNLDYLPTSAVYKNAMGKTILLTHAGFTPYWNGFEDKFYMPSDYELVWNREHVYEGWDKEHFPNHLIVHGHTPIQYLYEAIRKPGDDFELRSYRYCDGFKICIDCGTYRSLSTCLLDLDTLKDKLFHI